MGCVYVDMSALFLSDDKDVKRSGEGGSDASSHRTRPWTAEEDSELSRLIVTAGIGDGSRPGPKTWSKVAQHMEARTGKQCRER